MFSKQELESQYDELISQTSENIYHNDAYLKK